MSDAEADDGQTADHLDDVADGSGCTEIWEHLSERRDEAPDEDGSAPEKSDTNGADAEETDAD